jgi:hypothetical protein
MIEPSDNSRKAQVGNGSGETCKKDCLDVGVVGQNSRDWARSPRNRSDAALLRAELDFDAKEMSPNAFTDLQNLSRLARLCDRAKPEVDSRPIETTSFHRLQPVQDMRQLCACSPLLSRFDGSVVIAPTAGPPTMTENPRGVRWIVHAVDRHSDLCHRLNVNRLWCG